MKFGVFRVYITVAVVVCVSVYAAADVPFLNSAMFGSGTLSDPVSVTSADFDGDTHPDLAVVNRVSETVSVFLADGQGGFTVASSYQVGTAPEAIASADLDGDLDIDLVVCNSGSNTVQILLGDGHGSFTAGPSVATGTGPVSVTPCFLTGDSQVDLAVLCSDTDNETWELWLFDGAGDGSFSARDPIAVGRNPLSIHAFDLDDDGFSDFVWANSDENTITVMTDELIATSFGTGDGPVAVATDDLDSDGIPDLLVLCEGSAELDVFRGTGSGEFTVAASISVPVVPHAMAVGDIDGTGPPDFVVVDSAASALRVFYGQSTGFYSATAGPVYACGNGPTSVILGGFDSDSYLDAITLSGDQSVGRFFAGLPASQFEGASLYDVDWSPSDIVAAHVDTDAAKDLVVSNVDSDILSVLHGSGTGEFGAIDTPGGGFYPFTLAAGQFDGKYGTDVAVAGVFGGTITILLARPDGTLSADDSIIVSDDEDESLPDIAAADFNDDGIVDLAVLEWLTGSLDVLLGDGDGGFELDGTYPVGTSPLGLTVGLFDDDDILDAAVTNNDAGTVSIMLGDGNGGFGSPTTVAVADGPYKVVSGRFNSDEYPDLAVSSDSVDEVTVLFGQGDGTFDAGQTIQVGTGPTDLAVGDLNRDDAPDIVAVNLTSNDVDILMNDKTGGFVSGGILYPGRSPNASVVTDLDGNASPDLAVVCFESNTVVIYNNLGQTVNIPPVADAGADDSVVAGQTVRLDGTGSSDGNGDPLTYTWTQVSGPTVLLDDATKVQPRFVSPGVTTATTVEFDLVVSDSIDQSAADQVSITIAPLPNNSPTADAGSDQTAGELELVALDGTNSTDPDGDSIVYSWTQVSGPTVSLSDRHVSAPTFYTPNVYVSTDLVFQLVVNDGTDSSPASTVTVTVQNTLNEPPSAVTDGDQTVSSGDTVTMDGTGSTDPNGDSISYHWVQTLGQSVTLTGSDTAIAGFTAPTVSVSTVLKFKLEVTDGDLSSDPAIVTVVVMPVDNGRPTADARTGTPELDEGATATLDATSSSDPNGDPLTYAWTQTGGPAVVLSDPYAVRPTFTAPTVYTDTTITFSLIVSDGSLTSVPDTVTVTVLDSVNEPPVAEAGPNHTVEGGTTVWLHGDGSSDPNGDSLTYTWTQTGGPAVLMIDPHSEATSFDVPEVGTDTDLTFSLSVTDGRGGVSEDVVTITVISRSNGRPISDAGPDQTIDESATVTLDGTGSSDPNGDELKFFWTQVAGPAVSLTNAVTAQPSFVSPTVLADTVLEFSLQVSDGIDMSVADTVLVTIRNSVNEPPIADAGADFTVDEGALVSLDGTASTDPNGQQLVYTWEQISPKTPAIVLSDPSSPSPMFTAPNVNVDQLFEFKLTVSDGIDTAEDFVRVTVLDQIADRPVANAGTDRTVNEMVQVVLDGSASFDPAGGSGLTFEWIQTAGPSADLSDAHSATPSFETPPVTDQTVLVFSLTVSRDGVPSAPDTVEITVLNSVNEPPVADAGGDQTVSSGDAVSLVGSRSSDPNGDNLSYEWTQQSPTDPVVQISDADSVSPLFMAPVVSSDTSFRFRLTVNDGIDTTFDEVTVTVLAASDGKPVADAGSDLTVNENALVTLDGSASTDPDGDPLSYTWSQTDGPEVSMSDSTVARPIFYAPEVTTDTVLEFSLVVSDGTISSEPVDVKVTVMNSVNEPPVANAGPNRNVAQSSSVSLDGSASTDPNGDDIEVTWTQTGGVPVELDDSTSLTPTFTAPEQTGTLTFELEVSDGIDSDTDSVTITVTGPGGTDPADIDGDGKINAIDVQKSINQALGIAPGPGDARADTNGDGKVDAIDIQTVINRALGIT